MMVRGPEPKQVEDSRVVHLRPRREPAEFQANSTKGRSRRLRARTLAANSITSEEEDESFLVQYSVTGVQGCQERGDDELLLNTLIFTQNAGEQVHTKVMTLILDKDTGNTEDL